MARIIAAAAATYNKKEADEQAQQLLENTRAIHRLIQKLNDAEDDDLRRRLNLPH